jgi:glycosyltransferase involved in cell wall biosynthesis
MVYVKNEIMEKLIRITTVPISMNIILKGQLAFMNKYFEVIGISSHDEKHLKEVGEREGIKIHAIEMPRTISPIKDFIALCKLYLFFKKVKPTIVHTHTPKAGLLGMLAAKFAGVPIRLHTVGGMPLIEVKGAKRVLLNYIEKLTYACAHNVYPNSKGLKQIIIENNFCDESKLKVLGNGGSNGINTTFFTPNYVENAIEEREKLRQKLQIESDDLVFCFVGRIATEKGIVELLDVFEELQTNHKIKLILVGTFEKHYGILGDDIKQRIEKNASILFLGRFDDVRPYYAMSDIYVFPSYREGFPNSVLEASAMSLPCIVTDINGCNEIIEDGINGLLIKPKDRIELKSAMKKLIENTTFRNELSSNARPHVEKYFKREVVWNALLGEYNNFVNKIRK